MQTLWRPCDILNSGGEKMLSEKIRELRRKSGLSQEELADKLEVSRQAVSKWETGAAVPTTETLVQLADFFGVSLDFLLRDNAEMPIVSSSPKHSTVSKALGISLIAAAVLAAVLITILQLTGNGNSAADSSAVTLDGNGIIIGAVVLCAVRGIALLISSKK